MFLSRNKKNNVYPCKAKFHYIEVRFKGVKIVQACHRDEMIPALSYSYVRHVDNDFNSYNEI